MRARVTLRVVVASTDAPVSAGRHQTIPVEDPTWRDALEAVPRELFLDDTVFRPSGTQWEPVHRHTIGNDEWLRLVYQDTTWVTQIDGVAATRAPGPLADTPPPRPAPFPP